MTDTQAVKRIVRLNAAQVKLFMQVHLAKQATDNQYNMLLASFAANADILNGQIVGVDTDKSELYIMVPTEGEPMNRLAKAKNGKR